MTSTGSGRFIVVEGIDGCGSTTQAKRLVQALNERGCPSLFTFEPSDGPVGKQIRRALEGSLDDETGRPLTLDWASLALLFAADRMDHVARVVRPALDRGTWVVSDRYDLSSFAYQSATSGGVTGVMPWLRSLNQYALRPDLTLVIDVSAEVAAQRREARGGAEELFEVPELQRRLAAAYTGAERLVPGDRVVHIDGESPIDTVFASIWAAVQGDRDG